MRSRLSLPANAAKVLFLVGVASGPMRAQERNAGVVGYVLSVHGDWLVGPRAQITSSGRALLPSDTLRAGRPPWRGYEIVIVLRDGTAVRYRCVDTPSAKPVPERWNCAIPIGLAKRAAAPLHGRILDAVMNHFGEHPSRPTSLVSRSILNADLREAVTILQDGGLELSDALSALPADEYGFTLTPILVDGGVVERVGEPTTARLAWDPRAPRALRVPGLQPGLYELGLVGASDVAWVLVCAGAGCDAVRTQFREVGDMAARWAGQVAAPDVRAFIRAALDLLSRQRTGS